MKKRKNLVYLVVFLFLFLLPVQVRADMGPKPSVVIDFIGIEDEEYYVTLLSKTDSTGPWSYGNDYYEYMGDEAVFQKFNEYRDSDGYYFLSFMENCSGDDQFEWTYYPPTEFKILIYFPEYQYFVTCDLVCERYAFDSYFTVELKYCTAEADQDAHYIIDKIELSYKYTMEIVSLFIRIILTIAVECGIAWIFHYRDKKSITIIFKANLCTQLLLNLLLNMINYKSGQYAFVFHYIWMEIVVFVIEAIIYDKKIGRENPITKNKYHPYGYAAIANLVSLIVGLIIAKSIPGIF